MGASSADHGRRLSPLMTTASAALLVSADFREALLGERLFQPAPAGRGVGRPSSSPSSPLCAASEQTNNRACPNVEEATFRLANKAKPVCLYQHHRNDLVQRITLLRLIIGTTRMMLRLKPQSKELAAQSRQRSSLLTSPQNGLAR